MISACHFVNSMYNVLFVYQRASLGSTLTPVTLETFMVWKKKQVNSVSASCLLSSSFSLILFM